MSVKIAVRRVCDLPWVLVPPGAKQRDTAQNKGHQMNNRLLDIIRYKTGGRQNSFAEIMGWTPQYLAKLLRGENFGLQPVMTILEKLPEINARWFLFGEGSMLSDDKVLGLRRETYSRVQSILSFERFLPVMSPEEIHQFEEVILGKAYPDISDEQVSRWEAMLAARDGLLDIRVKDAMSKSITPSRHPKDKR